MAFSDLEILEDFAEATRHFIPTNRHFVETGLFGAPLLENKASRDFARRQDRIRRRVCIYCCKPKLAMSRQGKPAQFCLSCRNRWYPRSARHTALRKSWISGANV